MKSDRKENIGLDNRIIEYYKYYELINRKEMLKREIIKEILRCWKILYPDSHSHLSSFEPYDLIFTNKDKVGIIYKTDSSGTARSSNSWLPSEVLFNNKKFNEYFQKVHRDK